MTASRRKANVSFRIIKCSLSRVFAFLFLVPLGLACVAAGSRVQHLGVSRFLIVENEEQDVRPFRSKPLSNRFVTFENRGPIRVGLFIRVESETDGWRVRT